MRGFHEFVRSIQLEEETAAKERAIKAKRAADTELEELKDQLVRSFCGSVSGTRVRNVRSNAHITSSSQEESEERVLALEDQKRKVIRERIVLLLSLSRRRVLNSRSV